MPAIHCRRLLLCASIACLAAAAWADGTDDPVAARAACEKSKQADTPDKLKQCCDDQILADPPAKQARLVAQCVRGARKPKAVSAATG